MKAEHWTERIEYLITMSDLHDATEEAALAAYRAMTEEEKDAFKSILLMLGIGNHSAYHDRRYMFQVIAAGGNPGDFIQYTSKYHPLGKPIKQQVEITNILKRVNGDCSCKDPTFAWASVEAGDVQFGLVYCADCEGRIHSMPDLDQAQMLLIAESFDRKSVEALIKRRNHETENHSEAVLSHGTGI